MSHPLLLALVITMLGLGVCALSHHGKRLAIVFWWAGILVAVLGLLLILFPVLGWIHRNLTEALGT